MFYNKVMDIIATNLPYEPEVSLLSRSCNSNIVLKKCSVSFFPTCTILCSDLELLIKRNSMPTLNIYFACDRVYLVPKYFADLEILEQ